MNLAAASLWALLALDPGDRAPSVAVFDLEARPVSLEPNGQVLIIDFFATWCPSCRRSLLDYRSITDALGDRARVVVVDVKEPTALVRSFFRRYPLPPGVELARDPYGTAMRSFGAAGFPGYFVVDATGTIRYANAGWGGDTALLLVAIVKAILDGKAPAPGQPIARSRRTGTRSRGKPAAPAPTELSHDERARRMGVEILH